MNPSQSNSICICGHTEDHHTIAALNGECIGCWKGTERFSVRFHKAKHSFKRDNLKYLENLSRSVIGVEN